MCGEREMGGPRNDLLGLMERKSGGWGREKEEGGGE